MSSRRPDEASRVLQHYSQRVANCAAALFENRAGGLATAEELSILALNVVRTIFQNQDWQQPTALAVSGSFAQATASFGSDLDLTLYIEAMPKDKEEREQLRSTIERFRAPLWEEFGELQTSVRDLADSKQVIQDDHRACLAFVESKFVAGEETLFGKIKEESIDPKRTEQRQLLERHIVEIGSRFEKRHNYYGNSVYLLEPNLKEGKGGLRDWQQVIWLYGLYSLLKLKGRSLGGRRTLEREAKIFGERTRELLDWLLQVRHHCHLLAARKQDHLHFTMQRRVSETLGYGSSHDDAARFMQDYYQMAKQLERQVRHELSYLKQLAEKRPMKAGSRKSLNGDYAVEAGRLVARFDLNRLVSVEETERRLISFFELVPQLHVPLRFELAASIRQQLTESEALRGRLAQPLWGKRLFRLMQGQQVTRTVALLHDLGLLGAILPEFRRIKHCFIRDAYHIYTVDVHSLKCLEWLDKLIGGQLREQFPLLTQIAAELSAAGDRSWPALLFMAALLHDCGKGTGQQHEILSEQLAAQVVERLELSSESSRLLLFLIRHHLTLWHYAEHRDFSDPKVLAELLDIVSDDQRLKSLFVFSMADRMSVGPRAATGWQRSLLLSLYRGVVHNGGSPEQRRRTRLKRSAQDRKQHRYIQEFPEELFQQLSSGQLLAISKAFSRMDEDEGKEFEFRLSRWPGSSEGQHGYRFMYIGHDRPQLFVWLSALLTTLGGSILGAEIFSSERGQVIDLFYFQLNEYFGLAKLRRKIASAMKRPQHEVVAAAARIFETGRGPACAAPVTRSATLKQFDSEATLQIEMADRPGLLYRIAAVISDHGGDLRQARISTEGRQIRDYFRFRLSPATDLDCLKRALHELAQARLSA